MFHARARGGETTRKCVDRVWEEDLMVLAMGVEAVCTRMLEL